MYILMFLIATIDIHPLGVPSDVFACSSLAVPAEVLDMLLDSLATVESRDLFDASCRNALQTAHVSFSVESPLSTFYTIVAETLWTEGPVLCGVTRFRVLFRDDVDEEDVAPPGIVYVPPSTASPRIFYVHLARSVFPCTVTKNNKTLTCHSCERTCGQRTNRTWACSHLQFMWSGHNTLLTEGNVSNMRSIDDKEDVVRHYPEQVRTRHVFLPRTCDPADNVVSLRVVQPLLSITQLRPDVCFGCELPLGADAEVLEDGFALVMGAHSKFLQYHNV